MKFLLRVALLTGGFMLGSMVVMGQPFSLALVLVPLCSLSIGELVLMRLQRTRRSLD